MRRDREVETVETKGESIWGTMGSDVLGIFTSSLFYLLLCHRSPYTLPLCLYRLYLSVSAHWTFLFSCSLVLIMSRGCSVRVDTTPAVNPATVSTKDEEEPSLLGME
jgi:hypothetical protein